MLELKTDGEYEVEVVVNGIAYPFSVEVDGTAPTVTLKGVDNGGVTKDGVVISDLSEPRPYRYIGTERRLHTNSGIRL